MSARRQRESASERRKDIKKAARVCVCACIETRTGYKYSYGKYTVNPSKLKIISSSFVVWFALFCVLLMMGVRLYILCEKKNITHRAG